MKYYKLHAERQLPITKGTGLRDAFGFAFLNTKGLFIYYFS